MESSHGEVWSLTRGPAAVVTGMSVHPFVPGPPVGQVLQVVAGKSDDGEGGAFLILATCVRLKIAGAESR